MYNKYVSKFYLSDFRKRVDSHLLHGISPIVNSEHLQLQSLEVFLEKLGYHYGLYRIARTSTDESLPKFLSFTTATRLHNGDYLRRVVGTEFVDCMTFGFNIDYQLLHEATNAKLVEQVKFQRLKGGCVKVYDHMVKLK